MYEKVIRLQSLASLCGFFFESLHYPYNVKAYQDERLTVHLSLQRLNISVKG